VAANSPALHTLFIRTSGLGDAGLRGLVEALPRNTHLRELTLWGNGTSAAFARDVLLPALRANTSLRSLLVWKEAWARRPKAFADPRAVPFLQEAQALVEQRAAAAAS
jgi:hypothetical protein